MKHVVLIISILFFSCHEKPNTIPQNFNEKVVDFVIENANNKFIELPNLYDSLSKKIVTKEENEKLILVQILKKKGFKVTNWGRGNHPLGPRIVVLNLKKDNCECEVQKIFYANETDEIYATTERIKCKNL